MDNKEEPCSLIQQVRISQSFVLETRFYNYSNHGMDSLCVQCEIKTKFVQYLVSV